MKILTKIANFFAKYSTPRWNPIRPLRVVCRKIYQGMGNLYVRFSPAQRGYMEDCRVCRIGRRLDTYPWPYSDPDFAAWPEDDGIVAPGEPATDRGYTLISDPIGFVIRRPTSYCAWKIYEATGELLQHPKHRRCDAKDWLTLLAKNGYNEIVLETALRDGMNYVGVIPKYGEHGLVVWFERCGTRQCIGMPGGARNTSPIVSTYLPTDDGRPGEFECLALSVLVKFAFVNVTWVKIC